MPQITRPAEVLPDTWRGSDRDWSEPRIHQLLLSWECNVIFHIYFAHGLLVFSLLTSDWTIYTSTISSHVNSSSTIHFNMCASKLEIRVQITRVAIGTLFYIALFFSLDTYSRLWSGIEPVHTLCFQSKHFFKTGKTVIATPRGFRVHFLLCQNDALPDRNLILQWVEDFRPTFSSNKRKNPEE